MNSKVKSENAEAAIELLHRAKQKGNLLDAVMNQMPVGVIVVEPDGKLIMSNQAASDILGQALTPSVSIDEQRRYTGYYPDGRPYAPEEWPLNRSILRGEFVVNEESTIRREDGTIAHLLVNSSPVHGPDGGLVAAVTVLRDVTRSKRMERDLHRREQEFRAIVENSPDVFVKYDKNLQRLYVNPAMERFYGLPASDLEGKVAKLINVSERATYTYRAVLRRVFETGKEETIYQDFVTERGSVTHQMRLVPEFSQGGSVETVLGIGRDITDLKRLEDKLREAHDKLELRVKERTAELETAREELEKQKGFLFKILESLFESEEKYRALFDRAADLIVVVDVQGNVLDLNRKFEEESGHSRADMFGKSLFTCGILTEASAEKMKHFLQKVLEEDSYPLLEVESVRKDGGLIPYELRAVPIRKEGAVVAVEAILRNIEVRKKTEEAMKTYLSKLEQVNEELRDFASMASHDLQEPLRKIQAFADLLTTRYGDKVDDRGRFYLERMAAAAARMSDLIRALLTYSRVMIKGQPLRAVDLTSLLREVQSEFEVQIEKRNGRLEIGDLPTVDVDPRQMRQVFHNLIGNALKFCERPPVIKVNGRVAGDKVEIVVEDNGIGFDEKHLDLIFRPFERLPGRDQYRGTGIGLAVVKRIVERHNGRITVQSTPGRGSTFVIELPAPGSVAPPF